jgi:hypothetical protein
MQVKIYQELKLQNINSSPHKVQTKSALHQIKKAEAPVYIWTQFTPSNTKRIKVMQTSKQHRFSTFSAKKGLKKMQKPRQK